MKNENQILINEKIIKLIVDRILLFQFEGLMIDTIKTVAVPEKEGVFDELLIPDTFYLYQKIWNDTLKSLYKKYLPEIDYTKNWVCEITPYTFFCVNNFSNKDYKDIVVNDFTYKTDKKENEIESSLELLKEGLSKMGFDENNPLQVISDELLPASNIERFGLLYKLMDFPPLTELAIFYNSVYQKYTKRLETLSPLFSGDKKTHFESLNFLMPFHFTLLPFNHSIFKKYGIDKFLEIPKLSQYKDDFELIRKKANESKGLNKGNIVCPCCGEISTIEVPIDALEYKLILENEKIANDIGFIFHSEFSENLINSLAESLSKFMEDINKIDAPNCLILVEGESEEYTLPILALRTKVSLSKEKILVYNSKSKSKVYADFLSFREKFPNLKIVCVLDEDATTEKQDIERLVKDNKNKYELIYIKKGAFEDLFPIELTVNLLNELYPDGADILVTDFDKSKNFDQNIKKILFTKKKAAFDKVKFAKAIAFKLKSEDYPEEINRIFEIALKFANANGGLFKQ